MSIKRTFMILCFSYLVMSLGLSAQSLDLMPEVGVERLRFFEERSNIEAISFRLGLNTHFFQPTEKLSLSLNGHALGSILFIDQTPTLKQIDRLNINLPLYLSLNIGSLSSTKKLGYGMGLGFGLITGKRTLSNGMSSWDNEYASTFKSGTYIHLRLSAGFQSVFASLAKYKDGLSAVSIGFSYSFGMW